MSIYVKVCGLTTKQQIDKAIEYGYDAIGVISCAKSKRHCSSQKAIELAEYAKGKINSFIVGLTYAEVKDAADAFDYIQICEDIQIPRLVFSSKDKPNKSLDYEYFVYDASLGSGIFTAIPAWVKKMPDKLIVAGGLDKDNVCSVIKDIKPFGVDISSGVEKNGVKDFALMQEFIGVVRDCNV